jgi:hypothetical protein
VLRLTVDNLYGSFYIDIMAAFWYIHWTVFSGMTIEVRTTVPGFLLFGDNRMDDDDEGARHAPADATRQSPHPPRDRAAPSPAAARGEGLRVTPNNPPSREASADKEALTVTPNKNRLVQLRRTGGRKLFDKWRKEVFLEWFAATCNVALSAAKAGVLDKTVYKHLLKDAAFEEAFGRALGLGYVRLEARSLQEAHQPGVEPPHPNPLPAGERGYQVRVLDDAAAEEHFDPQLALQLLREHARRLGKAGPRQQRTTARAADNREIAEALAKRLKAFAVRTQKKN